jgi:hypothetical protein
MAEALCIVQTISDASDTADDVEGGAGKHSRLGDALENIVRLKAFQHFLATGSMLPLADVREHFIDAEYLGGVIGMYARQSHSKHGPPPRANVSFGWATFGWATS